jgi:hypothetical protein
VRQCDGGRPQTDSIGPKKELSISDRASKFPMLSRLPPSDRAISISTSLDFWRKVIKSVEHTVEQELAQQ